MPLTPGTAALGHRQRRPPRSLQPSGANSREKSQKGQLPAGALGAALAGWERGARGAGAGGERRLKRGVIHVVQPGGRAGGKVWVPDAAPRGDVGGGTPPGHGP